MASEDRLDSWKEIAAYLGREVRTVQLWEKSEALPVHRQQHARLGSVYAFKSELDAWRNARKAVPVPAEKPGPRQVVLVVAGIIALVGIIATGLFLFRRRAEQINSVVVLPFIDLSAQHDQEYFSDGLTEEIIDALSRVPNLRVVARTSAFSFKGKNNDIRQIGKQLNVNAVLEGSVRKDADQLRITAQLNRVSDGTHLWSRIYDQQLRNIFAVQREISQAIADQLRAGPVPVREAPHDLEAWRLYQEGRYFFNQFQPPESNKKAIDRYEQAIQRDPKFALAYAGLADAYAYLAENFVSAPREVMPKAKAAAEKAVELDPNSAEAHTSLGAVKLDYERDRDGAARELRKALELNPGLAWARHWYGHAFEAQNRVEDALQQMRMALALDPLNIAVNWDIGNDLICLGRYDEAVRHLKKADELFPNVAVIGYMLAEALARKGDLAGADRVLQSMKKNSPDEMKEPMLVAFSGLMDARFGRREQALSALKELEERRAKEYIEPFGLLELCAALHDEKQFDLWLKRLDDERSTLYVYKDAFVPYYLEELHGNSKSR